MNESVDEAVSATNKLSLEQIRNSAVEINSGLNNAKEAGAKFDSDLLVKLNMASTSLVVELCDRVIELKEAVIAGVRRHSEDTGRIERELQEISKNMMAPPPPAQTTPLDAQSLAASEIAGLPAAMQTTVTAVEVSEAGGASPKIDPAVIAAKLSRTDNIPAAKKR